MSTPPVPDSPLDRRRMLLGLGALGAAGVAAACRTTSTRTAGTASANQATSTTAAATSSSAAATSAAATTAAPTTTAPPVCSVTPAQTEGPYYVDLDLVRADITEGRAGAPLRLQLQVVTLPACAPVANAAVDIWHCDAGGVYSEFGAGQGMTFLRGTQLTDASGKSEFLTVYPGWYMGRTVHIHVKAHLSGGKELTSQLFFADDVTDTVYSRAPYNTRPARDMRNSDDGIFRGGGANNIVAVTPNGDGYVGRMTIGVNAA